MYLRTQAHGFNKVKDFVVGIQINTAKQIKEKENELRALKSKFNSHLTNITQREAKLNEKFYQLRKREQELQEGLDQLALERQNKVADNKRKKLTRNYINRSCQNRKDSTRQ